MTCRGGEQFSNGWRRSMTLRRVPLALLAVLVAGASAAAKTIQIDAEMHHLRAGDQREWSDFPARAEGPNLSLRFKSARNDAEWTLRLRQQDVKQTWKVLLNGEELGKVVSDE